MTISKKAKGSKLIMSVEGRVDSAAAPQLEATEGAWHEALPPSRKRSGMEI